MCSVILLFLLISECMQLFSVQVCKQSNEICMHLYEKELRTDSSFLYIYGFVHEHFFTDASSLCCIVMILVAQGFDL